MNRPLLDPKNDAVFKMLFAKKGNEDILIDLITAIICPSHPIKSLTLLNPETPKDHLDDKGIMLDIALELANGEGINIEMQMNSHHHLIKRAYFYACKLYSSQLPKGRSYQSLRKSISIFLMGSKVFDEAPKDAFHYVFSMREDEDLAKIEDMIQIQFVEIMKIMNQLAQSDREAGKMDLVDWCQFLCNPDEKEVKGKGDRHMNAIDKARKALEELSADPEAREIARMREKAHFDYVSDMSAAREEGREVGRIEERLNLLRKLLSDATAKDWPTEKLAQITGLTPEEVRAEKASFRG